MSTKYVLALDQGTTSSRAILFDNEQNIIAVQQREFEQIYPQQGWVEHNPMEIWSTQYGVMNEEAKVAVRNIRREAMDKAKAMKKAGELTEDSQKTMEEDVQKLTDKYIKNIDAAVEEKQKEIMSV